MILLVPNWAQNYPEYWNTIRRRNVWFLKLRYLAIISLFTFLFLGQFVLNFKLTSTQIQAIVIVASCMLLYNVLLQLIRTRIGIEPSKFNAMHFSLIQMLLDLTALMLLIYFTGTVESPLYVFFLIHMVIGSLILPGYLVLTICFVIISIYAVLIYFQNIDVLATHLINGINPVIVRPWSYDVLFILVFSLMMVVTVFIANRMARNLLKREEQLRQTLIQLDEAEKSKQRYLMGVVHEIKTPFSAINSISDILLQELLGPLEKPVEEKITRIKTRTQEGLHLINNILKISKLKLLERVEYSNIYIGELLDEYLKDHCDELKSKNITVRFDDKRKLHRPINGDAELIHLAFSNIISNAEKYVGENGSIQVTVDYEDEFVRIKIMDDGIGIPEKDQPKIFNQFYRATNTKRHKSEGSGLGLSVVKEIINHHQGTISVKSPSIIGTDTKPGTTFTIKLPYVVEEPENITLTPLEGDL